jgi:lysophospholipase L1-like esterase
MRTLPESEECTAAKGRLRNAQGGKTLADAMLAAGLLGSLALLPLVVVQGKATLRRAPYLPPAQPPHCGEVEGEGPIIRLLAIGESTVAGVGLKHGGEAVAATTAQALARSTGQPVAWRAEGMSGATVSQGIERLLPRIASEPADLLVVAFGVNDVLTYRSPSAFGDDLAALVRAARDRIGDAAVIIAGVAPLVSFPAVPWPLGSILGWRSTALQVAAERLTARLPRLAVERFSDLGPDLFAADGFHPNARAHVLWGEEIARLALPLLKDPSQLKVSRGEGRPSAATGHAPAQSWKRFPGERVGTALHMHAASACE